jgi:hypothetical protein
MFYQYLGYDGKRREESVLSVHYIIKRVNKKYVSSTMLNVLSLLDNWKWKIKE